MRLPPTRPLPARPRSPTAASEVRERAGGSGTGRPRSAPSRRPSARRCQSSDWRLSIPSATDPLRSGGHPRAHHGMSVRRKGGVTVNIGYLLRHSAMCFPDRQAVSWRGATLDYRAFDARSAVFAEWLASIGGAPGERVVLYL